MATHIYMAVGLEVDAFLFQEGTLATPAWSGAALLVDDTMAGEEFGSGGVAQGAAHHS